MSPKTFDGSTKYLKEVREMSRLSNLFDIDAQEKIEGNFR
jgi:hypothetical protein